MSDVDSGAEQVNSVPDSGMQPSGEPQSPRTEPAQSPASSGYRPPTQEEYQRLLRSDERARGADQWLNRAKELGYNSLDEAMSDLTHTSKVKQRGVGIDRLAELFGGQQPEEQEPDIRSVISEMLDERFSKQERSQAESSWQNSIDSELKKLDSGLDKLSDEYKVDLDLLKDAMANRVHNTALGNPFGEGHPLKGQPNYEGAAEKVLLSFKETMAKKAGADAAAIGEAATKKQPKVSTPAGKAGGQGEPESTGESREEQRRALAAAHIERRKAARAGAATSQS